MMPKFSALATLPQRALVNALAATYLWITRKRCPHPAGSCVAATYVAGFGDPIIVRRCSRCGAEVKP